jgi:hypothetical protein
MGEHSLMRRCGAVVMVLASSLCIAAPERSGSPACFGRFLVDVPLGGVVYGMSSEYLYGLIGSKKKVSDKGVFEKFIKEREEIYKGVDKKRERVLVRSYSPNSDARIITTVEDVFGRDSFGFEAYALKGSFLFSMEQQSYNGEVFQKRVLPKLETMLANLRLRQSQEIPPEPGLCVQNGFIKSDGSENAFENIRLNLDFKKWPDLNISIETMTMAKAEPSLLERLGSAKAPEIFMSLMGQIKTLRRGVHNVGSIKGEESLNMVPTDEGYKVHQFRWESRYELDDPFKPVIIVELSTGQGEDEDVRPTISEKEAVELFDAVVNSIRLRPTGPAKRSEAAPIPKAPLGEMATTGRQCPQTGRWRAEEGEERLIREGEVMPHTPVSGTASLWQKLRGEAAPIYRSATVWKLVAYEMPADDTPPDSQGSTG